MRNILSIFLLLCCVSIAKAQPAAQSFPESWIGNWKGNLEWYAGSADTPRMVPMQLRIQKADSAGHYTWHLIYGQENKDSRPYILKPVSNSKNRWVIDELNGILLDQYYIAGRLSCVFTVGKSTIVNNQWLEGDVMWMEFYSVSANPVSTTGKGTEDAPFVNSFGVQGYQVAKLKRL
jgi:hypothetical protein